MILIISCQINKIFVQFDTIYRLTFVFIFKLILVREHNLIYRNVYIIIHISYISALEHFKYDLK